MSQSIDWQGHRGARGLLPENSIPAFRKALELGVTTLEMDVVVSRDGFVLVSHDPFFSPDFCLDPLGNKLPKELTESNNIYKLDYEEIKKYDCGSMGNPGFQDQLKEKTCKPLLTDVFKMAEKYCKDFNRNEIRYNIEIKSQPDWDNVYHPDYKTFCIKVYENIDAYVPWKRVTIQSFDFRVLNYFHENYPQVQLAALEEKEKDEAKVIAELGFFPSIYSPYYKFLDNKSIKWLHENEIKIIPWTVNNKNDIQHLLEMGVDGIITDYPNLITEFNK